MKPRFGVVIPVGPGRVENLRRTLQYLARQGPLLEMVVLVCDGPEAALPKETQSEFEEMFQVKGREIIVITTDRRHEPGDRQPRNVGAAFLEGYMGSGRPDVFVAFLDSDVLVGEDWLAAYAREIELGGADGCYIGPYDFMPPGHTAPDPSMRRDVRWATFDAHEEGARYKGDPSKGLACFSGNLVWCLRDFIRVGGFWDEIHHARCEDGELGLRAAHMGIRFGLAPGARGWHVHHRRNMAEITRRNARDIPMIEERHPWVETSQSGTQLFVVDEDGKRFNARCACGWEGNTAFIWGHQRTCPVR